MLFPLLGTANGWAQEKTSPEVPPPVDARSIWPEMPDQHPKYVEVWKPQLSAPEEDSFRLIAAEESFPGQIVYSVAATWRALVFRSLGRSRRLGTSQSQVVAYRMVGINESFAPHWYPQSDDIYFHNGDQSVPGYGATTYLWSFLSKKISSTGFGSMQLRDINWSPSGQRAAYLESWQDARGDMNSRLMLMDDRIGSSSVQAWADVNEVSWIGNTLIYAGAPEVPVLAKVSASRRRKSKRTQRGARARKAQTAKAPAPAIEWRPCLYALPFNPTAKKQSFKGQLLLRDAYHPSVSPDGRWIAYTGWLTTDADGQAVERGTRGAQERFGLCVLEWETEKRFWLRPDEYEKVLWFPNSEELLLVQRGRIYRLKLKQLLSDSHSPDLIAKTIQPFAEFTEADAVSRQYQGFSRSGKFFFIKSSLFVNWQFGRNFHRSLQALDIGSGQIKTVFEWTKDQSDLEDFDWLDESLPPSSAAPEKRAETAKP